MLKMLKNIKIKQQFTPWQIDSSTQQYIFSNELQPNSIDTESFSIDSSKKEFLKKEEGKNLIKQNKFKDYQKKQSFRNFDHQWEINKNYLKEKKCSQSFEQSKKIKKSEIFKKNSLHLLSINRISQTQTDSGNVFKKNKKKYLEFLKIKNRSKFSMEGLQSALLNQQQNNNILQQQKQKIFKQFKMGSKKLLKIYNLNTFNQQQKNRIKFQFQKENSTKSQNSTNYQYKNKNTKSLFNFQSICLPHLNLNFNNIDKDKENRNFNNNDNQDQKLREQSLYLQKDCLLIEKQQRIQRSSFKKHKKKRSDIMLSLKNLKQQSLFFNKFNEKSQCQGQGECEGQEQSKKQEQNLSAIDKNMEIKNQNADVDKEKNQQKYKQLLQSSQISQFFDDKMKMKTCPLQQKQNQKQKQQSRKILLIQSCQQSPSFNSHQKTNTKTSSPFINEYLKIKQKKIIQQQKSKFKTTYTHTKKEFKEKIKAKVCSMKYRSVLPKIQIFYQNQINNNCDLVS